MEDGDRGVMYPVVLLSRIGIDSEMRYARILQPRLPRVSKALAVWPGLSHSVLVQRASSCTMISSFIIVYGLNKPYTSAYCVFRVPYTWNRGRSRKSIGAFIHTVHKKKKKT